MGDGPSLQETRMLQVIIREFIKPASHVEHWKLTDADDNLGAWQCCVLGHGQGSRVQQVRTYFREEGQKTKKFMR